MLHRRNENREIRFIMCRRAVLCYFAAGSFGCAFVSDHRGHPKIAFVCVFRGGKRNCVLGTGKDAIMGDGGGEEEEERKIRSLGLMR